jgi:hypothetical protein
MAVCVRACVCACVRACVRVGWGGGLDTLWFSDCEQAESVWLPGLRGRSGWPATVALLAAVAL